MYLQGKWRRGRVHTASCRCYRLIDREYHNLMVRFPLLSPNHQHCSWQENFVIGIIFFLYLYLYLVFGQVSLLSLNHQLLLPILLQGNSIFCICMFLFLVTCILYLVRIPSPPPPNHPVKNIVCKGTDSPEFYLLLLMSWRMSFVFCENLDLPGGVDVVEDKFCFV